MQCPKRYLFLIAFCFIDQSNIDVILHNCKRGVNVSLPSLVFRNYYTFSVSVSVEGMRFGHLRNYANMNFALTENKHLFLNVCVYIYSTCISYRLERAGLKRDTESVSIRNHLFSLFVHKQCITACCVVAVHSKATWKHCGLSHEVVLTSGQ